MVVWPSFNMTSLPSASSLKERRIRGMSGIPSTICTFRQKSSRAPDDSIGLCWVLLGWVRSRCQRECRLGETLPLFSSLDINS